MERYIGMDVHSTTTTCVVLSPSGRQGKPCVVQTDAKLLRDFVQSVKRPRIVVMEEGNQSDWLHEVLWPVADDVLVVQPGKSVGNKSDALDASELARRARLNEPGKLIYKSPRQIAGLRQAARAFRSTKKDLTRIRSSLKLLLQSRGHLPKSSELLDTETRASWLELLPTPLQHRGQLMGIQLSSVAQVHELSRAWMLREARQVAAVMQVKTIPGIGDVRAAQIVAVMVSPHRFRTKRQLWRYSGLAVVHRSTNDWRRGRHGFERRQDHAFALGLNRDRNPILKEAFVGAAEQVIRHMPSHSLHRAFAERVERGMSRSSARLTLARKIAAIVLAVWKKETTYDPKLS